MVTQDDLKVKNLGESKINSPLKLSNVKGDGFVDYVADRQHVALTAQVDEDGTPESSLRFQMAGPRQNIFFDPARTRAAIVTCGGLCPGLNTVVRSMVLELHHFYGVKDILGFRYGFEGLASGDLALEPMRLTPDVVRSIHREGGSLLGLSRGKQDPKTMVDTLVRYGVDVLFGVGGDGTLRGLHSLYEEVTARKLSISVVAVPKTVDNDISFVDKTFGFDTAVEIARDVLDGAHVEAVGARNGVGLVKLMGRDSGFIAAHATLASEDVNICLVPEVPFQLEGPNGLYTFLKKRLAARGHALIVIAEGCGAELMSANVERDASGNVRYAAGGLDVGTWMRDDITKHFKGLNLPINVKYIDPSYLIRSVPANASDNIFCDSLARNAVHAGMAGKTDVVIGRWHRFFTHIPLQVATSEKKRIDPEGPLWLAVTEGTGQPAFTDATPILIP